jgi:DNA-binding response OmpR family regulator
VLESMRVGSPIDVVCTDADMPRLSGDGVCRVLRGAGYRGLILLCTGHADTDVAQQALGAGADGVLVKPVLIDRVLEAVSAFLRRRGRLGQDRHQGGSGGVPPTSPQTS